MLRDINIFNSCYIHELLLALNKSNIKSWSHMK